MIKVNGRDREWEENLTVDLLLKEVSIPSLVKFNIVIFKK